MCSSRFSLFTSFNIRHLMQKVRNVRAPSKNNSLNCATKSTKCWSNITSEKHESRG